MRRSAAVLSPAVLSLDLKRLMVVTDGGTATIPLEDLDVLVLDNTAVQLTGSLLGAIGAAGASVVVCGTNHMPSAILLPFQGNVLMNQTLRSQILAPAPAQKRTWQEIIRAKIRSQARFLHELGFGSRKLDAMPAQVFSGDTTNREAAAAAIYFPKLFGPGFVRLRRDENKIEDVGDFRLVNALLNYGYAAIRAATARAVVGAGLHPSLGLHHKHRNNAFCLVDDLMEPLRVIVERRALAVASAADGADDLTPSLKREILGVLTVEVGWGDGTFPLDYALERYAASVRRCLAGEIRVPETPIA